MGFYFHRTPPILEKLFPTLVWRKPNTGNEIYLTFDDGPTVEVTTYVLDVLLKFNVRATFFCLGRSLKENPILVPFIEKQGHVLANHGYDHLDGWKISKDVFKENKEKGWTELNHQSESAANLFRPPYGHNRKVINDGVVKSKTIMWSLMAGDFDQKLAPDDCLQNLIKQTTSGDIVVMHDNFKSFKTLKYVLPKYLEFCQKAGFKFGLLE